MSNRRGAFSHAIMFEKRLKRLFRSFFLTNFVILYKSEKCQLYIKINVLANFTCLRWKLTLKVGCLDGKVTQNWLKPSIPLSFWRGLGGWRRVWISYENGNSSSDIFHCSANTVESDFQSMGFLNPFLRKIGSNVHFSIFSRKFRGFRKTLFDFVL